MLRLLPDDRSYALTGLQCGNEYKFKIRALNRLGEGQTSDTLSVTTKGNGMLKKFSFDRRKYLHG